MRLANKHGREVSPQRGGKQRNQDIFGHYRTYRSIVFLWRNVGCFQSLRVAMFLPGWYTTRPSENESAVNETTRRKVYCCLVYKCKINFQRLSPHDTACRRAYTLNNEVDSSARQTNFYPVSWPKDRLL